MTRTLAEIAAVLREALRVSERTGTLYADAPAWLALLDELGAAIVEAEAQHERGIEFRRAMLELADAQKRRRGK